MRNCRILAGERGKCGMARINCDAKMCLVRVGSSSDIFKVSTILTIELNIGWCTMAGKSGRLLGRIPGKFLLLYLFLRCALL